MFEETVDQAFDYLVKRLGTLVKYKRLRSSSYDPDTGTVKTFWEEVEFPALVYDKGAGSLAIEGGELANWDAIVVFKRNAFTKQPGEATEPKPGLGDELEFHDAVWTPAEVSRRAMCREDPTRTLFYLGVKRVSD